MSSKPGLRAVMNRLARFEEAARAHEMRGCQYPDDADAIENDYERAKADLHAALRKALHKEIG